jgi:hypothetical protein
MVLLFKKKKTSLTTYIESLATSSDLPSLLIEGSSAAYS